MVYFSHSCSFSRNFQYDGLNILLHLCRRINGNDLVSLQFLQASYVWYSVLLKYNFSRLSSLWFSFYFNKVSISFDSNCFQWPIRSTHDADIFPSFLRTQWNRSWTILRRLLWKYFLIDMDYWGKYSIR